MNKTDLQRLWRHVELPDGCWIWSAGTSWPPHAPNNHYGRIYLNGSMAYAHRLSYEMFIGPIAEGMTLDHLCRNTLCVNPNHLEAVPHIVNVQRGNGQKYPVTVKAANRTCKRGHQMNEANTHWDQRGRSRCRACHRELARTRRAKVTA